MIQKILSRFQKKTRRDISHIPKKRKQLQIKGLFPNRKKRRFYGSISRVCSPIRNIQKNHFLLFLLACIVFIVLFGIFGPIFKVDKIFITREDTIININKAYSNVEYIRGKSIFFIDTNKLAERLQKGQESIQNIKIEIKFPHSLNIYLKSYTPLFQSSSYLLLANGLIIKNESDNFSYLPNISLSKDIENLVLFQNNVNVSELKNIRLILEKLPKNIIGFSPENLTYFIDEKELLLSNSSSGTIFIFDLNGDINKQVKQLAIFQKEGGNITEKKYIYIDARINKKLFLCSYEEEFNCRNNLKNIYGESVFKKTEEASSLSQL